MHLYRCSVVSRCKVWPADPRPATCHGVKNLFSSVSQTSHLLTNVHKWRSDFKLWLKSIHFMEVLCGEFKRYRLEAAVLGGLHCLTYWSHCWTECQNSWSWGCFQQSRHSGTKRGEQKNESEITNERMWCCHKDGGFLLHLNVHRFISKCMWERRRCIDEWHDAQTIVHKSHVGHNDTHDGLWRLEERTAGWRVSRPVNNDKLVCTTLFYVYLLYEILQMHILTLFRNLGIFAH